MHTDIASTAPRRRRLSVEEKLKILDVARTRSTKFACAHFNVRRSSVAEWRNVEAVLRGQKPTSKRCVNSNHANASEASRVNASETTSPPQDGGMGNVGASDTILVGIHGEYGGFPDIAAKQTFRAFLSMQAFPAFDLTGYPQLVHVLEAVAKGDIDYAFGRTETLLSTTNRAALDRVISLELRMMGEVTVEEKVVVCALPATKLRDVDCIMSDWCLLSRFEEYVLQLEGLHRQAIHRLAAWDSATAGRLVREEQAEKTLVLCSQDAAAANGLKILDEHRTQSKYAVVGQQVARALPFEALNPPTSSTSSTRHWMFFIYSSTSLRLKEILQPLALLSIEIERFNVLSDGDKPSRLDQSCVISLRSTSGTVDGASLSAAFEGAGMRVVQLGTYISC